MGVNFNISAVFFIKFIHWLCIIYRLVPLSPIVSLDIVRMIQAKLAMNSYFMKSKTGNHLVVNSCNLNDELG